MHFFFLFLVFCSTSVIEWLLKPRAADAWMDRSFDGLVVKRALREVDSMLDPQEEAEYQQYLLEYSNANS